jgi:hypothetical protein
MSGEPRSLSNLHADLEWRWPREWRWFWWPRFWPSETEGRKELVVCWLGQMLRISWSR